MNTKAKAGAEKIREKKRKALEAGAEKCSKIKTFFVPQSAQKSVCDCTSSCSSSTGPSKSSESASDGIEPTATSGNGTGNVDSSQEDLVVHTEDEETLVSLGPDCIVDGVAEKSAQMRKLLQR